MSTTPPPTPGLATRLGQVRLSKLALLLGDLTAFLLSFLLATEANVLLDGHALWETGHWFVTQTPTRYYAWLLIALAGLGLFLARYQHYSERKPFWNELGEIWKCLAILALLDIAAVALTRWNASRLWWLLVWVLAFAIVPLLRALMKRALVSVGLWLRPTVLVGAGHNAHEAVIALRSEPQMGFFVVGMVDVEPGKSPRPAASVGNQQPIPRLTEDQLKQMTRQTGLQVVVALEHAQADQRERWLRKLAKWKVQDVCVIPAMRGVPLYGTDISYFFSHEVALLRIRNNLQRWPARLTKRVFDFVVALLALVLLSPLMLYLALCIRKDGGKALFSHQRIGLGGKPFPCFKFRSMAVDAEVQLQRLLSQNPAMRAEWEREHKLRDDPRVSQVGQFLRRTSLDELPQLFNVLRGEMSLVGPRPITEPEIKRYGDDVDYFLMVRPGMTGLWQVSGRNDLDYDARVYLDTWYVKNWALWYDIAILFKTIRVVAAGNGAY